MHKWEKFIEGVQQYIRDALQPLAKRIKDLEERPVAPIPEELHKFIDGLVARYVGEIPKPKDGEPGKDGASVTVEDVLPVVRAAETELKDLIVARIEEAVKAIPVPKNGKDGAGVTIDDVMPTLIDRFTDMFKGFKTDFVLTAMEWLENNRPKDGSNGENGKDGVSVTIDDVMPVIEEAVSKLLPQIETYVIKTVTEQVGQIPLPKDGEHGKDGEDGKSVDAGEVAAALIDDVKSLVLKYLNDIPTPVDGKDVTKEDIERVLEPITDRWALNFERRMTDLLQRLADKVPVPVNGKDGKDGLGFDDFEETYDGRRTFTRTYRSGDRVKTYTYKVPMLIEAGIYERGKAYERGDCVTWGGSYWTALVDTIKQPGDNNEDWRLVVRKGRDGRDKKD